MSKMNVLDLGPNLEVVEFGNSLQIAGNILTTTEYEDIILSTLMQSYRQAKEENFPEWRGFPEIHSRALATGGLEIWWYAAIPKDIVFLDSEKERELWDE